MTTKAEAALAQFRDVVVVNHDRLALELSLKFKKNPPKFQRDRFGGTRDSGFFYLFRDEQISNDTVMECVVSVAGDAITSLYKNHRSNATVGTLVSARTALVEALSDKVGLSVGAVGIEDEMRGRTLGLADLSTGQLLDLLAERMGATIATTDSHASGIGGGVLTVGPDGSMTVVSA